MGRSFTVIFTQSGGGGPFRIWRPVQGYDQLFGLGGSNQQGTFYEIIRQHCAELKDVVEELMATFQMYEAGNPHGPVFAEVPPTATDPEWLRTFRAFSTDPVEGASQLSGELDTFWLMYVA